MVNIPKLRLKEIAVAVFSILSTDDKLLSLLEIPTGAMKDIREQIIEDKFPSNLVTDNMSRLCVYETPSIKSLYSIIEKSFFEIDIYVTKEKNAVDRRVLLIANRLLELLHSRNINGLELTYYNRLPNLPTESIEWVKYGVVFCYDNFII